MVNYQDAVHFTVCTFAFFVESVEVFGHFFSGADSVAYLYANPLEHLFIGSEILLFAYLIENENKHIEPVGVKFAFGIVGLVDQPSGSSA